MSSVQDRLADIGFAVGWSLVKRLPERPVAAVFRLIADRIWRRRGKAVRRLESNLARVVGKDPDDPEVRVLSRRAMRSALRYYMEAFRMPVLSAERIEAGMRQTGGERIFEAVDSGRGIVCALPHMGNYDVAAAWLIGRGYPLTSVAERLKPESLFQRFIAYRESIGIEIFPLTGGTPPFPQLAERLRKGRAVALVSDRDLTRNGVEVEFFGGRAKMPAVAALSIDTGAAFCPATLWFRGEPLSGGRRAGAAEGGWGLRIHEEIPVPEEGTRSEKVAVMTQAMARVFEKSIAEHPEDWHMLQRFWLDEE